MNETESRKFEAALEDGPGKKVWLTVNLLGIEKQAAEIRKEANNKQAAEYIRRLVNGELPEMKVAINYSESETAKDRIKEVLAS